jgi:hypothetical protein
MRKEHSAWRRAASLEKRGKLAAGSDLRMEAYEGTSVRAYGLRYWELRPLPWSWRRIVIYLERASFVLLTTSAIL